MAGTYLYIGTSFAGNIEDQDKISKILNRIVNRRVSGVSECVSSYLGRLFRFKNIINFHFYCEPCGEDDDYWYEFRIALYPAYNYYNDYSDEKIFRFTDFVMEYPTITEEIKKEWEVICNLFNIDDPIQKKLTWKIKSYRSIDD